MDAFKEAPVVELADAFESDYFVGIPSIGETSHSTGRGAGPSQDRSNPWKSPNTRKKQFKQSMVYYDEVPSSNADETPSSLTAPISWTPSHPNQIKIPSPPKRPVGRPRTRRSLAITNAKTETNPTTSLPYSSAANIELSQPTFRPPVPSHSTHLRPRASTVAVNQLSSNTRYDFNRPPTYQPTFAGAPNFTTFGNGTPQTQTIDNFHPQFLTLNRTNVRVPTQAHSFTAQPSIIRPAQTRAPAAHTNNTSNFQPQAQPVRPAFDDFLKHLSTDSGLDVNMLMKLVDTTKQTHTAPTIQNNLSTMNLQQALLNMLPQQQNFLNHQRPPMVSHLPRYPMTSATAAIQNFAAGLNSIQRPAPPPSEDDMARQDLEADANGDEEFHEVETYSDYVPAKLTIGLPHPDPVVETSSLSTVEPPDISYNLKLPDKIIKNGLLSSLQLESVIYACQQHSKFLPDNSTRCGFLIGDGAGVGKGRTIAGIIYENYLCGRKKSIWFSVSTDLKLDAERDLRDVGVPVVGEIDRLELQVNLLNKYTYGKKITAQDGVIFSTYSGLVSKSQSIRGNLGSRLGQLIAWAGSDFDGVIVFDECHKAKNISVGKGSRKISKAAELVLEIQNRLPNARVVYASATGASETKHLGYMVRLGIWGSGTPYGTFSSFCEAIERRGVGAMELVAVDLKMRGYYIARQLSFKTTSFEIKLAKLTQDFIKLYDQCVDLWSLALKHFREAEMLCASEKKMVRTMWSVFWAAHQKFFKYLCISVKVPVVVEIAKQALNEGKCVVIGLQSTGEAKTLEALEDGEINEFISTAKATFESLIENHFPCPVKGRRIKRPASRQASTDSEINFSPLTQTHNRANKKGSTKSGGSSSSSTIDDTWRNEDSCKFIVEDGIALPHVGHKIGTRSSAQNRAKNVNDPKTKVTRNKRALSDLLAKKKAENANKSARALRLKRRSAIRQGDKSRIKKNDSDSDTEISNPLSSCSSDKTVKTNSDTDDESYEQTDEDDDDDDDDTITEEDGSDEDLVVVGSKPAEKLRKKNKIDDDSDSDVQITDVRPRRQEVVILDSDCTEEDTLDEGENPVDKFGPRLILMQNELFDRIDQLGPSLPSNTLDDLIDRLGGPSAVAEMTGRKGRVVKDSQGQIAYKQRNEIDSLDAMNIAEKERFMKGEKLIAIISEAASSGVSLQADKRVSNKRRRVHITIELPWSADRAIQQFGRTHRSNQLSGPEYVFIISELSGEVRFASIVAKRLESLGALTHGDRRATTESRDLSQFNIASRFCRQALEHLARHLETNISFANIAPVYSDGDFILDAREAFVNVGLGKYLYRNVFVPESISLNINMFLNRILGMKVGIQNAIFKLFTDYTERLIARKKVSGQYDSGILELNSESGKTQVSPAEEYNVKTSSGLIKCTLRNVKVERGISWNDALDMYRAKGDEDTRAGFYVSVNPITKAKLVYLLVREGVDVFRVFKPNTGRQPKLEYFYSMESKAKKVSEKEAERIWSFIYNATDTNCVHICFFNNCKRLEAKRNCDVGLRHRFYCILSGGILTIWPFLEQKIPEATEKIQIVRLRMDANNRVIGPIIPQDQVHHVRKVLEEATRSGIKY